MRTRIEPLIALAAALAVGACDQPSSTPAPEQPGSAASSSGGTARPSGADVAFLSTAAMGSAMELQASALAERQAVDPRVLEFARRMKEEHGRAAQELSALAAAKGVTLPADLDAEQRAKVEHLQTIKGSDFDRGYAAQMVSDHTLAIELFQQQARSGADPQVRDYTERWLPVLREHLQQALELPGAQ